jgi:hypothetical protein
LKRGMKVTICNTLARPANTAGDKLRSGRLPTP